MKYRHVYSHVFGKPWAILPDRLEAICQVLRMRAAGDELSKEEIQAVVGAGPSPRPSTPGTVAMIPIYGIIAHRMNMVDNISGPGGTSIEKTTKLFRQAMADGNVKAIVFDIDSPGGSVDGVPELGAEILAGSAQKKIVAQVDTMAASAAYWLASQASEIIVTPSGAVGSIGVFMQHEDISKALEVEGIKPTLISAGKYKVDGNPYEPLSDTARSNAQSTVDSFYSMFVSAVAKGRGVAPAEVRAGFGEGRMVLAAAAIKENMADKVATMDDTLARFGVSKDPGPAQRAGALAARSREIDLT